MTLLLLFLVTGATAFSNYCNVHKCSYDWYLATNASTKYLPSVHYEHSVTNFTNVLLTNITFRQDPNLFTVTNTLIMFITIHDIKIDICYEGKVCWLHLALDSDQKLTADIDGQYVIDGGLMIIEINTGVTQSPHRDFSLYIESIQVCIGNPATPDRNHCNRPGTGTSIRLKRVTALRHQPGSGASVPLKR